MSLLPRQVPKQTLSYLLINKHSYIYPIFYRVSSTKIIQVLIRKSIALKINFSKKTTNSMQSIACKYSAIVASITDDANRINPIVKYPHKIIKTD